MKLETFESVIQKELKMLRLTTLLVGVGFIFVFILVLFSKQDFYFNRGEFVKERPLGSSVCYDAFMSIVNHRPAPDLVTDEILNSLKSSEFNVAVDDVLAVQMIEENKCRLISKSNGKIRSFIVQLIGDKKNKHFYKLSEINEVEVSQTELTVMNMGDK